MTLLAKRHHQRLRNAELRPDSAGQTIPAAGDERVCELPMRRAVPRHACSKAFATRPHRDQWRSYSVPARQLRQFRLQTPQLLSASGFPLFLPRPPGHQSSCSPRLLKIDPGTSFGLCRGRRRDCSSSRVSSSWKGVSLTQTGGVTRP